MLRRDKEHHGQRLHDARAPRGRASAVCHATCNGVLAEVVGERSAWARCRRTGKGAEARSRFGHAARGGVVACVGRGWSRLAGQRMVGERRGDRDGRAGLFPAREVGSRLRCRFSRTRAPGGRSSLTDRTKHTATAIRQPVRPRAHVSSAASGRSAGRMYTDPCARATHDQFTQSQAHSG
jgi:hypothetical protein